MSFEHIHSTETRAAEHDGLRELSLAELAHVGGGASEAPGDDQGSNGLLLAEE